MKIVKKIQSLPKGQKKALAITVGVIVVGITAYAVGNAIRKRRIVKRIMKNLDATQGQDAYSANLESGDLHKASLALDPNFQARTQGSPSPSVRDNFTFKDARDIAREIYSAKGGMFTNDGAAVMAAIRKAKTQGELSAVAFVYENAPLNFGNLADDLGDSLGGAWHGRKDRLNELNAYLNSLPY